MMEGGKDNARSHVIPIMVLASHDHDHEQCMAAKAVVCSKNL